jgi:FolB domain-containing protein
VSRLNPAAADRASVDMDKIIIQDLEVQCRVGVPNEERVLPQRLLITIEMVLDLAEAAATDDLSRTIDYYTVSRRVLALAASEEWRLIERLASDVATLVLRDYRPARVRVAVKKFVLPEARWVAVELDRSRA